MQRVTDARGCAGDSDINTRTFIYAPTSSVYHRQLPPEGATAHSVRLQVSRLEHHGGVPHRLLLLHVDPHLHGLQTGVDAWLSETGQCA